MGTRGNRNAPAEMVAEFLIKFLLLFEFGIFLKLKQVLKLMAMPGTTTFCKATVQASIVVTGN